MKGKIAGSVVLFVLVVGLLLSVVLKNKTIALVESQIEQATDGQLKYDFIKVSWLRSFPRLQVEAANFRVEKNSELFFKVDTINALVNTRYVLKDELNIINLSLINPLLKMTKEDKIQSNTSSSQPLVKEKTVLSKNSFFDDFSLQQLLIKGGCFNYFIDDSTQLTLQGCDFRVSGMMKDDRASLNVFSEVAGLDYKSKGFSFSGIPLGASLTLDYKDKVLYITEGKLSLAHIDNVLTGDVQLDDKPYLNLKFESSHASLDHLLTLLPLKMFKDSALKTTGDVNLNAYVKGAFQGTDIWPEFEVAIKTNDASFGFADKALKVEQVAMNLLIQHPASSPFDETKVLIDSLSLRSGDDYVQGRLQLTHLVSDPFVESDLEGDIDLTHMTQVFPVNAEALNGKIVAQINMKGPLSAIADERYEDFNAGGFIKINDYFLKNKALPQGLSITQASFSFSPEKILLRNFYGALGTSDLNLQGSLSNYIAYVFDDEVLVGDLKLKSKSLDLNEFRSTSHATRTGTTTNNKDVSSPFMVPAQLNLVLNTQISTVKLDNIEMTNCHGKVSMKNKVLNLENLSFNALGGRINLNGDYNTKDPQELLTNLVLDVKDVRIEQAAKSLSVLRKSLPIAQSAEGNISSKMTYSAVMNEKGTVDLNRMKTKGYLKSDGLHIANNPSLNRLSDQMHDVRYKDITTSSLTINFEMANGKLDVTPFDVKVVDKTINAGGWYKVNNTIDFKVKTTVKAKEIGGDVNKYVAMLSDANKPLPVTILLTGNAQNPDIKYDTRDAINILRKDVTKNLNGDAVKSILKGFFK